ncbi:uncharacterized protein LOC118405280 [Branchiostoma floridae]|uniref:Uncharacterized protein LOC118405280 n=1 Tax=Branchiostoma floridae TaxID=7739 RepID=A0A9J7KIH0_BRAFL|nr:uncharacterized protein LOC118405280 [Branchiostoma floridae]
MPSFKAIKIHKVQDVHKGDQLVVDRGVYKHHMIVSEDPTDLTKVSVIQYTNDVLPSAMGIISGSGRSGVPIAVVRRDVEDISSEVRKRRVYRIDYDICFSPDTTVWSAESKLGKGEYSPFTNNCEHFATWCKTDRHESAQVNALIERLKKESLTEGAKQGTTKIVSDPTKEGAKTTMNKGVESVAMEVVKELTKAAVKKSGPDMLKELASNPILLRQAINEATESIMKRATNKLVFDPNVYLMVETFVSNLGKENMKQFAQEGAKTVIKDTAKTALNEGAKSLVDQGAKQVAREGGKTAMKETSKTAVKESARSVAREGSRQVAKSGGKSLCKKIIDSQGKIGIVITGAVEVYDLYNRTCESKEKLDNGEISQGKFEKQVVTHVVKGVASGAATLVGGTLGQTLIPIPVLGGMIGGMAGKAAVMVRWVGTGRID